MIQAEAGSVDQMANISSVFWNRLNHSAEYQLLQSDPTTKYVEEVIKPHSEDYNQTLYYWVEKGQPLPAILDEDREDSVFLGCFDDEDGQQYVAGTPVMDDLVLVARWEQKEE